MILNGFIGSAYVSRSLNFDCQRSVNLYLERSQTGKSKSPAMLVGTPGLEVRKTFTSPVIRGMIVFKPDVAYIVSGYQVHKVTIVDGELITTEIGSIENGSSPVSMESNGIDIFIAAGSKGYTITTATDTVAEYIDVSFVGADRVIFVKGSFVFNEPNSGRFWAMDPYSFTLDPLYFATAEGSPDNLVSIADLQQEVWLLGGKTTEVWAYTGDTNNFPFQQITGAFIEWGCAAKFSVQKLDNSLFWLSADEKGQGIIVRSEGYRAKRISTYAMEQKIAGFSRIDDAVALSYQEDGHLFYQINFPTADVTLVYDVAEGEWHERTWRYDRGNEGRHRANNHIFFNNQHLVGDYGNGNLYEMSLDFYSDAGNTVVRRRVAAHTFMNSIKVGHTSLQIDMQRGVGLNTGQGSDPMAALRWSDDGGASWSNEKRESIGKMGDRKSRVRFTRLGSSNDRVYELVISDPVKVAIIGAWLNE